MKVCLRPYSMSAEFEQINSRLASLRRTRRKQVENQQPESQKSSTLSSRSTRRIMNFGAAFSRRSARKVIRTDVDKIKLDEIERRIEAATIPPVTPAVQDVQVDQGITKTDIVPKTAEISGIVSNKPTPHNPLPIGIPPQTHSIYTPSLKAIDPMTNLRSPPSTKAVPSPFRKRVNSGQSLPNKLSSSLIDRQGPSTTQADGLSSHISGHIQPSAQETASTKIKTEPIPPPVHPVSVSSPSPAPEHPREQAPPQPTATDIPPTAVPQTHSTVDSHRRTQPNPEPVSGRKRPQRRDQPKPSGGRPKRMPIIKVRGRPYAVLSEVGKGASGKVYKVITPGGDVFALKEVRVDPGTGGLSTLDTLLNELEIMRTMSPTGFAVKLLDSEVSADKSTVRIVMELGETDLRQLFRAEWREKGRGGHNLNFLRLYFQQMVEAVQVMHEQRYIHGDLKPANFLMCCGQLKLIDFGISKQMQEESTCIMREEVVGTLNYIAPEVILSQTNPKWQIRRSSDVWSLASILYQMAYGRPPFAKITNPIQKIACITNRDYRIKLDYPGTPPPLTDLLARCLTRDPHERLSTVQILEHPLLTGKTCPSASSVRPVLLQVLAQLPRLGVALDARRATLIVEGVLEQVEGGKEVRLDLIPNLSPL
eukprot:gnl/Dysnectes_brevis/3033_a3754_469.p1 GENE.gnl/Dysnectes_brevis/3033_a3754_469~~gnl/Dysnectes_brevis/3033_a3754_469.p1  ORF type:complete len:649 (-),score=184.71 gnl/Dysnectes_brevis/3033_a3754_469:191-2137(-)